MAKDTGEILPALQTRVTPHVHLAFVWDAFGKLSTERSAGFGVGPIPVVTAIERYARDHQIIDIERFVTLIRRMDDAWLAHMKMRSEKPQAS